MDALHECLTQLNIPHELVKDLEEGDETNVYLLCTAHHTGYALPKRYIAYNLEQLTTNKFWEPEFFEKLRRAELVLDYSVINIEELKKHNIQAHFLPIGYTSTMEKMMETTKENPSFEKTIDVVFFGYPNQHRVQKLLPFVYNKQLTKLVEMDGYWGDKLKEAYKKSKIGLNIHLHSGRPIFEITRIILLIANKVLVMTERSADPWYDEQYKNLLYFFKTEDYHAECMQLLGQYSPRLAEEIYDYVKTNYAYVNYIKEILPFLTRFV
jgi:hypothetical protein